MAASTTAQVQEELAALRREVAALRPAPPPPGPRYLGRPIDARVQRTLYWTQERGRVVGEGDPLAAHLLIRGGIPTSMDQGTADWLEEHEGIQVERLTGQPEPPPPSPLRGPERIGYSVDLRFTKTLYLTADRSKVVEAHDPEAAYLLGNAGTTVALPAPLAEWLEREGIAGIQRVR